jgi:hypothetical protein
MSAPHVPADEIEEVLGASGEPLDVSLSLETTHECVAVVRLRGARRYQLAVYAIDGRGRSAWSLRPSTYESVGAALALVSAVVLQCVETGWRR